MRLYNSLTGTVDLFTPPKKDVVKLYVCGITPYDTTHLGHALTYIFFDVLVRYLKFRGYQVNYVQNVTDIDDDILREAKKQKTDWKALGDRWTKRYLDDMVSLNVTAPTHFIKATDSIGKMVEMIKVLENKGFAYQKDGNVYFSVEKDQEYGKLSRLSRTKMITISKERGADPNDPNKKDPLDFLLWQRSKVNEPFWPSPWGQGRPGWHIECSAMIHQYLGATIDFHGGGKDLIFPHHESEIAQSEAFTGQKPFSRFFLHTTMLLKNGQKMSKSLKNVVMVRDLLKKYSANSIRWYILSHHYRQPFEYSESDLERALDDVKKIESSLINGELDNKGEEKIIQAMDDDLNTPAALNILKNYPSRRIFQMLGFVVK